jgi:hypothetical protein
MKRRSGEIKQLGALFEAYKHRLKAPEKTVIHTFVEVVEDVLLFTIKPDLVRYTPHNRILSLTIPGPLKSEILLKKKELLRHLKGRLGVESAPKDIL